MPQPLTIPANLLTSCYKSLIKHHSPIPEERASIGRLSWEDRRNLQDLIKLIEAHYTTLPAPLSAPLRGAEPEPEPYSALELEDDYAADFKEAMQQFNNPPYRKGDG